MTGINITINQKGITKGYAILYSELNGYHIAQLIDDTTKVIFQTSKSTQEDCFEDIKKAIATIGVIKSVKETKPDEGFINLLKQLKEE